MHDNSLPVTRTSSPAVVLREERLGIAEEKDVVTLDTVDFAPSVHDPRVVRRNDSDDVNALALELREFLDVGRKVVGLAARCECAGNRDKDDLLACPLLVGIVLLGTTAGSGVSVCNGGPPAFCESQG